jgi:hypothetical protein
MLLPSDLNTRIERIAELHKELHGLLGERSFDDLAIGKSLALRRKLEGGRFEKLQRVCLAHNLRHAAPMGSGREYVHLPRDFLADDFAKLPDHSVYLLLNNDIGRNLPRYVEFVQQRPGCLFIVWDWDSQHWLQMGCLLAAHADLYVPSTSENLYTLSHFNPHLVGPAFAAVNQWSRQFVIDHLSVLVEARRDEPFGPHVRYGGFDRRNRAVATLNQSFPAIGFADDGYQQKSDLDNLKEWAGHKAHWIVPVLGGVPIRVYNCLLTGGIPVVPVHYRNMPENLVLGEDTLYYDVIDLVEPRERQAQAVKRFDEAGAAGVISRVGHALAHHHIDARIEQVLQGVEAMLARVGGRAATGEPPYLMAP